MSKVILDNSMSLDGLIAQPDDDPGPIQEFLFSGETEHDGMFRTSGATTEVVREFIDGAGAVIIGRRTYDVTNGWEGNYPMRVPCFVVTHNVPTDVPDGPTQFTYVTDGIESAVRQAKAVAGEKDVSIMGGASIARQALEAKLLDEVEIHLSPVTPVLTVAEERRVDERVERARRAEAEVVLDPTQQPWGYPAAFADPDGHLWQVTPVAADPLFAD